MSFLLRTNLGAGEIDILRHFGQHTFWEGRAGSVIPVAAMIRRSDTNISKTRNSDTLMLSKLYLRRFRNMQKFVSCLHHALGCGLRIRKHYRERHARCCAFKIIHDMKMKQQQQGGQESSSSNEAASATSGDHGPHAPAMDCQQGESQRTHELQQQSEKLVDLSVSLQWGGPRELHTALLLPLLSRLLPNVSGVKEGRFFGEFDVILKQ